MDVETPISGRLGLGNRMAIADRFAAYVGELTKVIGHADREGPLRDYCSGLLTTEGPCQVIGSEGLAHNRRVTEGLNTKGHCEGPKIVPAETAAGHQWIPIRIPQRGKIREQRSEELLFLPVSQMLMDKARFDCYWCGREDSNLHELPH